MSSSQSVDKTVKRLPDSYYDAFLSDNAKERKPSPIRGLFPLEQTPGLISLLAGKPNAETFPFLSLSFKAKSPTNSGEEVDLTLDDADLKQGLQYGATAGMPKLLVWLNQLQETHHGRKQGEGWRVSVGSGSQDLIFKAVQALVNPGDAILVESPVYAGVIPMFSTLHCEQVEVETDSKGIKSSSLRSILENWPSEKAKPKVLYTVPYGCNPTGMTATLERRKEVLELAREHSFIILEDDPYYYLYYGKAPRYPSYFSLEREEPEVGRVVRFDSLSKILSAGVRIGFASGPEKLLNAIDLYLTSLDSNCPLAVIFTLLNAWGQDGFKAHTERVADSILPTEARPEWDTPEAGMFFWFKLILKEGSDEEGDSDSVIRNTAFNHGVLALPGTVFLPNGRKTAYVRAAFSLATEDEVDLAVQRLRQAILDARGDSRPQGLA
ncbi:PLP-dependent transferase [Coprinopsis sp. MPI-PUGE-AT-0042]|nr:PLP-dependent transferase [Coprinopsis sp. MPI-PUGE-AT-0042]